MFSKEELKRAVDVLKESEGLEDVIFDLERILEEETELEPVWLLNRNACIATIAWYREDVENALEEDNIEASEENINFVLNNLQANTSHCALEDCSSGWETIHDAIYELKAELTSPKIMGYEKGGKAIAFDDYNMEEDYCWVSICPECFEKYKDIIEDKSDECGQGICSVRGCSNEADYYVDFNKDEVFFIRKGE